MLATVQNAVGQAKPKLRKVGAAPAAPAIDVAPVTPGLLGQGPDTRSSGFQNPAFSPQVSSPLTAAPSPTTRSSGFQNPAFAPQASAPNSAPGSTAPRPTGGADPLLSAPSPATRGGSPAAPYAQTGAFDTSTNLIGTTIAPNATRPSTGAFRPVAAADTSGAMQAWSQANDLTQQQATPGYEAVDPTNYADTRRLLGLAEGAIGQMGMGYQPSAATAGLTQQTRDALDKVMHGPDRAQLASDQFQLLQEQGQPGYEARLRKVGQLAGALGRIGSGVTTSQLGDVASEYNTSLAQNARQLSLDAAGQTLDDRLKQLDAVNGIRGGLAGADAAAYGAANAGAGQRFDAYRALAGDYGNLSETGRADALTERDARINAADRQNQVLRDRASGYGTYGDKQYGAARDQRGDAVDERTAALDYAKYQDTADAADRAELRGERDYQYGLSQDATTNAIRQKLLEDQLYGAGFDRNLALLTAGSQGNPASLYGQQAGVLDQQGSDALSGALDLFARSGYGGSRTPDIGSVPQIAGDFSGAVPDYTTYGAYGADPLLSAPSPTTRRRTRAGG